MQCHSIMSKEAVTEVVSVNQNICVMFVVTILLNNVTLNKVN